MKQLNITFHFNIEEEYYDKHAVYDLVNSIIDEIWDTVYKHGLEPDNYEIKEIEVNAGE